MAIDFNEILTVDQKRQILEQRILQYAAARYENVINKEIAEKTENQAGIDEAEKNILTCETGITVHKEHLDSLPPVE
jgi:hypothetical protein